MLKCIWHKNDCYVISRVKLMIMILYCSLLLCPTMSDSPIYIYTRPCVINTKSRIFMHLNICSFCSYTPNSKDYEFTNIKLIVIILRILFFTQVFFGLFVIWKLNMIGNAGCPRSRFTTYALLPYVIRHNL